MCKMWVDGYCHYGSKCHFAHGEEELAVADGLVLLEVPLLDEPTPTYVAREADAPLVQILVVVQIAFLCENPLATPVLAKQNLVDPLSLPINFLDAVVLAGVGELVDLLAHVGCGLPVQETHVGVLVSLVLLVRGWLIYSERVLLTSHPFTFSA